MPHGRDVHHPRYEGLSTREHFGQSSMMLRELFSFDTDTVDAMMAAFDAVWATTDFPLGPSRDQARYRIGLAIATAAGAGKYNFAALHAAGKEALARILAH